MELSSNYVDNNWLGQLIDPLDDPWYRFSRLLCAIDVTFEVPIGSSWLDLGCHQGQFICISKEVSGGWYRNR